MSAVGVTEVAGWCGALALLVGYTLFSAGRLANGGWYHGVNLAGAAGLVVNGLAHGAWPSTILNVVWMGIGAVALTRSYKSGVQPSGVQPSGAAGAPAEGR